MLDAIMDFVEPIRTGEKAALKKAAEARLNQCSDADSLLAAYAEAAGMTIQEAQARVTEYLDDCLT